MHTSERSVQRFTDARNDGPVQVDSRYVAFGAKSIWATLGPRPPKHVESFARSHASSETVLPRSTESVCLSPSFRRRCSGAITAGGSSPKSQSRACAAPLLINIHTFAKLTWSCWSQANLPVFCSVASSRLRRRLGKLAQAYMHEILHIRSRAWEAYAMSLAWDLRAHVSVGSSRSSICSNPGIHTPHVLPRSL